MTKLPEVAQKIYIDCSILLLFIRKLSKNWQEIPQSYSHWYQTMRNAKIIHICRDGGCRTWIWRGGPRVPPIFFWWLGAIASSAYSLITCDVEVHTYYFLGYYYPLSTHSSDVAIYSGHKKVWKSEGVISNQCGGHILPPFLHGMNK